MKKIIGMLALSACTLPCTSMASAVELDGFGSYIETSNDTTTPPAFEPSGEGGGLRARISAPLTGLFLAGEFQQNDTRDDSLNTDFTLTDTRVGLGKEFSAGVVSVLAKFEYVHLKGEFSNIVTAEDTEEGFGVHIGADAGMGLLGVYGSAGYLRLGEGKGPEVLVGIRGSLLPLVGLFAEYRYTELRDAFNTPGDTVTFNDFRVGVRVSL